MKEKRYGKLRDVLLVILVLALLVICVMSCVMQVQDIDLIRGYFDDSINPYNSVIAAALAGLAGAVVFVKRNHLFGFWDLHNS